MYKGRTFNREQLYICGDFLEGDIYPVFQPPGKRRSRCNPTRECQKRLNQVNCERIVERIVHLNFAKGDYWIHPTWAAPVSKERAQKDIRNLLKWLERRFKKAGIEFKYLMTMEYGEENGKVHAHIMIPRGVDRDLIQDYWEERHGKYCDVDRLFVDEETGLKAAVKYMCKPHTKASPDGTERFFKKWSGSRNLRRPSQKQIDGQITMDELEQMAEAVEGEQHAAAQAMIEKHVREMLSRMDLSPDEAGEWEFVAASTYRNEINRGVYVHFEMRKKKPRAVKDSVRRLARDARL